MVVSDLAETMAPVSLRQLETELTGWLEQHNYAPAGLATAAK